MNVTHGLRRALQISVRRHSPCCSANDSAPGRNRRACRAARRRAAGLGVDAGDRVAVLMLNQDRYLELYLAVAWAGAVIVPVNIRWSPAEIEDFAARLPPRRAGGGRHASAELGGRIAHRMGSLRLLHADDGATPAGATGYEDLLEAASPVPDAMRDANDLAGIFYTGGTTGRSKGVMLSHRQPDGERVQRARRRAVPR